MPKYIVNAAVENFATGEVVEIDPRLFEDLIAGKFLSPIDDFGNRLNEDGEILVLSSTTEEQRRENEGVQQQPVAEGPQDEDATDG